VPRAEPKRFSTDLRAVLLTVFPEYRGTSVKRASATLTRQLSGSNDWPATMRALFARNRVTEIPDDGGVSGRFDLFVLRLVEAPGGRATATISLPIDEEVLGKLYTNPAALSTEQLGLYLPKEGLRFEGDEFSFELEYDTTTDRRAAFLSRQLIELLLGNGQWRIDGNLPQGWQPNPADGGYGDVPDTFSLEVLGVVDGARVSLHRASSHIHLVYRLATLIPAR
jgi:hypothetical protein